MNSRTKLGIGLGAIVVAIGALIIYMTAGNSGNEARTGGRSSGIRSFFSQSLGGAMEEDDNNSERMRTRELSDEEKAENEREFKRMREKIPGNMFIPGELTEEEGKERRQITRDIIVYGNKVRKGTATREEKKRYYELRVKESKDKLEFLNYIIGRSKEKSEETGKTYLDEDSLKESGGALKKIQDELKGYEEELRKI